MVKSVLLEEFSTAILLQSKGREFREFLEGSRNTLSVHLIASKGPGFFISKNHNGREQLNPCDMRNSCCHFRPGLVFNDEFGCLKLQIFKIGSDFCSDFSMLCFKANGEPVGRLLHDKTLNEVVALLADTNSPHQRDDFLKMIAPNSEKSSLRTVFCDVVSVNPQACRI